MFRRLSTKHRARLVAIRQYLLAQGITVASNLLYGLLCVRLVEPADYAKFVVLFGVQGTFVILMDVGVTGSLIPLVGEQIDDRQLIADYVASIRSLARWLYLGLAVCLAISFPLLVHNRLWSPVVIGSMVAILLLSTWFMRISATYGAVLILLQDRASWYRAQMISAVGTLVLLVAFKATGLLGAFQAILINVAGIVFVGTYYYRQSQRLLVVPGSASQAKMRAAVRLTLPNVPGIVFYALQGQIALFLITVFGRTTSVASVGALSRLGQIFVLFSQMNMLLIEPYFARIPATRVWKNYAAVMGLTSLLCLLVVAAACAFPGVFLLVLGPSYSRLTVEVKLVVAASALSYLTNVLWSIHSARRFIYWCNNIANIVLTVAVHAAFILKSDLSSVRAVVLLNFATVLTAFVTNSLSGLYGYFRGPRVAETPSDTNARAVRVETLAIGRNNVPSPTPLDAQMSKHRQILLIQIVPNLFPVIDGIGDYALQLARQLRTTCGIETTFIVCDPTWPRDRWNGEFQAQGLLGHSSSSLVSTIYEVLKTSEEVESSVLLHFSPYGYQKRGCPLWLVRGMESLVQRGPTRLGVAFHELDVASAKPWSSGYWVPGLQRTLIKRLAKLSSFVYTNTGVHKEKLESWSDRRVTLIPNFSNIGESGEVFSIQQRAREIVVFGRADQRRWSYERGNESLALLCRYLGATRIVDVGAPIPDHTENHFHGVPVDRRGILPAGEVASIMRGALANFMHYPIPLLTKSGVHALACASGAVSFVATDTPTETFCTGLLEGVDYIVANDEMSLPTLAAIEALQAQVYSNYQKRSSRVAARTVADWLGTTRMRRRDVFSDDEEMRESKNGMATGDFSLRSTNTSQEVTQ